MKRIVSALMSLSLLAGVAAMPAAAAETYSMGDVDMNGVVDTRDVALIIHDYVQILVFHYSSSESTALFAEGHALTEEQQGYADVDSDGYLTSRDALSILQYYVYNLVTEAPVSPDSYFADPNAYDDAAKQDENYVGAGDQAMQELNDYDRT